METITKKVLKTENRPEYMKNYMKEYNKNIKNSESFVCDICGGKYKKYSQYMHNKGKLHNILNEKILMKNEINNLINKYEIFEKVNTE